MTARGPGGPVRRRGFSLIEMVVVTFMMALMASLMAGAWAAFGRPAVDVEARCRIAQEASLAAESLARDLSGYRPSPDARLGDVHASRFVGRLQPEDAALWICFDSQAGPNGIADWASPDAVVSYYVDGDRLVRWDQDAGTAVVVARHVAGFRAVDQGWGVDVQITLSFRKFTRTYTLIGVDP